MSTVQLDDWEAGELSVEFEGCEPWELLEWAIERFGEGLALSTSFQEGGVALIDMAYAIDPEVRIFSIDTGRLPEETYELVETLLERYPGLRLEMLQPDHGQVQRLVERNGPNLFRRSVDLRLLCCNVRKVQPLNSALDGLDAWVTALRRDQWASRSDIRKVEIDHDHDAIVKLNPLAEWTEDEVWDYIRENDVPVHPLYERGFTSIGCAPCTRAVAPGEPARSGRGGGVSNAPEGGGLPGALGQVVVGDERPEGVRDALRDRDRRLRARAARHPRPRGRGMSGAIAVRGEERDLALSEVEAVLAAVPAGETRERLDAIHAAIADGGPVAEEDAPELERLVTLALQTGRARALYGPGGEQALLRLYRRLPAGVEAAESAAAVTEALGQLRGKPLERMGLRAVGPGAHALTLEAGGLRLLVHLDRNGARLASVETSG